MEFETLKVETREGICTVTLNRPDKFNAMNLPMRRELADCFEAIADDTAIKVVVLTGAGTAFCGGGDIGDFQGNSAEQMHALMGRISHKWFRTFWNVPQPVIGAINGAAAGGGCNFALACDLVYASENAYFAESFGQIGLIPDLGGTWLLPRLVGPARAKEMALFGERVPAAKAEAIGLVNAVFPPDQLLLEVMKRATRLAAQPASMASMIKKMMNRSFERSMEAMLDEELAAQSFLFGTEASRQGVDKFLSARGKARKEQ